MSRRAILNLSTEGSGPRWEAPLPFFRFEPRLFCNHRKSERNLRENCHGFQPLYEEPPTRDDDNDIYLFSDLICEGCRLIVATIRIKPADVVPIRVHDAAPN